MSNFENIGREIGSLVQEKNDAYGDSFGQANKVLEALYPNGVRPDQYLDMLAVVRVIDKLFRIANKKDAFGESPWKDICGYSLLGIANDAALQEENSGWEKPKVKGERVFSNI